MRVSSNVGHKMSLHNDNRTQWRFILVLDAISFPLFGMKEDPRSGPHCRATSRSDAVPTMGIDVVVIVRIIFKMRGTCHNWAFAVVWSPSPTCVLVNIRLAHSLSLSCGWATQIESATFVALSLSFGPRACSTIDPGVAQCPSQIDRMLKFVRSPCSRFLAIVVPKLDLWVGMSVVVPL